MLDPSVHVERLRLKEVRELPLHLKLVRVRARAHTQAA